MAALTDETGAKSKRHRPRPCRLALIVGAGVILASCTSAEEQGNPDTKDNSLQPTSAPAPSSTAPPDTAFVRIEQPVEWWIDTDHGPQQLQDRTVHILVTSHLQPPGGCFHRFEIVQVLETPDTVIIEPRSVATEAPPEDVDCAWDSNDPQSLEVDLMDPLNGRRISGEGFLETMTVITEVAEPGQIIEIQFTDYEPRRHAYALEPWVGDHWAPPTHILYSDGLGEEPTVVKVGPEGHKFFPEEMTISGDGIERFLLPPAGEITGPGPHRICTYTALSLRSRPRQQVARLDLGSKLRGST